MVFVMRKRTRPPATTATQTSTYANQVLYDTEAVVLKLPFGYQVVLTTPTVKLVLNALAINVVLWRLALTMLPATTGKPLQSVILKTLHTQPASIVREGNANQVKTTSFFVIPNSSFFSGCVTDANCPSDYKCSQDHICGAPPGKVLIQSITVRTKTGCSDCSKEGVTLSLRGEKNANAVDGVPCSTKTLDHSGTTDYDGSNGSAARFDGTLNGAENDAERTMMGGCYQVGPIQALAGSLESL